MKSKICYWDDLNAPFETYLLVSFGAEPECTAYEISEDTRLDIDELLQEVFKDYLEQGYKVETTPEQGGSNYAAIMTDNRAPSSPIVWQSCNFYLVNEDN